MVARLDHVVIAVPDVAGAAARWMDAGLPAAIGGRHPGGTVNALVRGPDPAYIELIGVGEGADGPWADRVRGKSGPLSWAVAVDDMEEARAALVDAGFAPGPVQDGARETPTGVRLSWRLCEIAGQSFDAELPFLIEWIDGMPPGPAEGAQLIHVTVTPTDPARLAAALKALRMPMSAHFPDVLFGAEGGHVLVDPGSGGFSALQVDSASATVMSTVRLDKVDVDLVPGVRGRRGWPVLQRVRDIWATQDVPSWPDPQAGRTEPDPQWYSGCLDPAKYRVLGLRVDAWTQALSDLGIATGTDQPIDAVPPRDGIAWSRLTRIEPSVGQARALWVGRRGFEGHVDNGVVLGMGDPPVMDRMLPFCGCDACDDGSVHLLDALDEVFLAWLD